MIEMTWISALLIGAACFVIGCLIGSRRSSRGSVRSSDNSKTNDGVRKKTARSIQLLEVEKLADIIDDFKMVLVVRNDLKMGKGKIAAQCSHATLGLYKKILNRAPKSLNRWEMCGQVKVVVKIESEDDMLVLQERAKSLNLPAHISIDAGRTQIAPSPADLVDDAIETISNAKEPTVGSVMEPTANGITPCGAIPHSSNVGQSHMELSHWLLAP
ncbi:peptidyl-tRNA hydrolase [Striga asiatica]|uniref:peptidyl-tRNA hydrolase n=1 Tax=Striga asiatica TaxID=4170 RepID=A0A5A7QNJ2_STRAF|nr:peptidyl-tRNA hydrolase [Striga asiatica]